MTRSPKRQLTEKEKIFVEHFARTDDVRYAAAKAGFSQKSPSSGYELLDKPLVRSAIENRRLAYDDLTKLLPKVVEAHGHRLLGENGFEKPNHGEFARLVVPFYAAVEKLGVQLPDGLDVSTMSADELGRALPELIREANLKAEALEQLAAGNAKLLEGVVEVEQPKTAPKPAAIDGDDVDIFQ